MDFEAAIVQLIREGTVRVPPYPATALKLAKVVGSEDFSLDDLVAVMKPDALLTADVLRVANSAFYFRNTRVSTLPAAIARIGSKDLVRLAMASSVGAEAHAPGPLAALRRNAFHHSISSALMCEAGARPLDLAPDEAFVCGLLHDIGQLVTIACLETLLQRAPDAPGMSADRWALTIDRFHVELGLVLAARWNLPDELNDIISQHHASLTGAPSPMMQLVRWSDDVNAILNGEPTVESGSLGARVPHAGVRAALGAMISKIPEVIASFEQSAPTMASKIQPQAKQQDGKELTVAATVLVNPPIVGKTVFFTKNRVSLRCAQSLPEANVVQLALTLSDGPLEFWARVVRCERIGNEFELEVAPFALPKAGYQRWLGLVS